jgi:hypothetical protein
VVTGRKIVGATNPLQSEPGTVRGDFCIDVGRNLIHGALPPGHACSPVAAYTAWEAYFDLRCVLAYNSPPHNLFCTLYLSMVVEVAAKLCHPEQAIFIPDAPLEQALMRWRAPSARLTSGSPRAWPTTSPFSSGYMSPRL